MRSYNEFRSLKIDSVKVCVMDKVIVAIPAYQRANLLFNRVEEILRWDSLSRLIISVDGLRNKADASEFALREKVISTAELLAKRNRLVDIIVWDQNPGVNWHNFRLFSKIIDSLDVIIVIEDDVSVSNTALNFLKDNCGSKEAKAAVAHSSRSHDYLPETQYRNSIFPAQWGQAITKEVVGNYIDTMKSFKIEHRLVRKALFASLGANMPRRKIESLAWWWSNHFSFCLRHGNWADAIVQYSVMKSEGVYRVPARSLIKDDVAPFDFRALTPRFPYKNEALCQYSMSSIDKQSFYCYSCELQHSNLESVTVRNLIGGTKHRIRTNLEERLKSSI